MMTRFLAGLGLVWGVGALYQYARLAGDPDRGRVTLQFLGMAAVNMAVAGVLNWMRQRREGAG